MISPWMDDRNMLNNWCSIMHCDFEVLWPASQRGAWRGKLDLGLVPRTEKFVLWMTVEAVYGGEVPDVKIPDEASLRGRKFSCQYSTSLYKI